MSTKWIRLCLEHVPMGEARHNADAEVDAIEKAARDMRSLAPAELVALFKATPKAPEVLAWLNGYEVLLAIAKESGK